jgi:hypothetical protein
LGLPIGEEITIQGMKFTNGPLAGQFRVDELNGKRLSPGVILSVAGMRDWPDKAEATLRGHEEANIRYCSVQDGNLSSEAAAKFVPQQKIYEYFRVREVITPKDLKIGDRERESQ